MSTEELKRQISELQKKLDRQLDQEEKDKQDAKRNKIETLKLEIATYKDNLNKKQTELDSLLELPAPPKYDYMGKYKYPCDHCSSYMTHPDEHRNRSHTWTNGQSFYTCQKDYAC